MLRKRLLCIVISCVIFICPLRGEGSTEKVRTYKRTRFWYMAVR